MTRRVSLFLLGLCLLALPSCLSYHARFDKAVASAGGVHNDHTGPWIGRWKSDWNGHEGPLWCIVTETPGQPNTYDFRYRAGWGILQFGNYVHTVELKPGTEKDLLVKGQMDLPKLVGMHSIDGSLNASEFKASFKSEKGDHGTMTLRRPKPKKAAAPVPELE